MPPAPSSATADLYGRQKPSGYYANAREDLVRELPPPLGRVLDVGCGEGAVARTLRAYGASSVTGVEVNEDAAARAGEVLDRVLVGRIEDLLPTLTGPFDTICCYDVLEHLVDPGHVLSELRGLASAGGRLQVSVPNARHISLLIDLALHGTFGYSEWGHRDVTHLRWFTRRDIVEALQAAGWQVAGVSHPALHRSRALAAITRGRSSEFLVGQWYVLARRAE